MRWLLRTPVIIQMPGENSPGAGLGSQRQLEGRQYSTCTILATIVINVMPIGDGAGIGGR